MKKFIVLTVITGIIFSMLSATTFAKSRSGIPSLEDHFAEGEVHIGITDPEAMKKDYTPEDFPGINCIEVIESARYDDIVFFILKLGDPGKQAVIDAIKILLELPFIDSADPNYIRTPPETDHTHIPGAAATCTEEQTCSECGEILQEALGHSFEDATCITPKTCERCGATEGEANPDHHTVVFTADVKCHDESCPACGKIVKKGAVTDRPVHSFDENGLCGECGKTEMEIFGNHECTINTINLEKKICRICKKAADVVDGEVVFLPTEAPQKPNPDTSSKNLFTEIGIVFLAGSTLFIGEKRKNTSK